MTPKAKFPKTRTLGVNNWIKSKTAVTPGRWKFVTGFMKLVVKGGPYYKTPVVGSLLKKAMMFTPPETSYTLGYVLPLNEKLAPERSEGVVMPIDMIRKAVREASYRAIMNRCICRDGNDCRVYPHDLGCIFLGEASRALAERGVGREATVEEALAHVDRAAALGLVGQSLWIEVEQYIWGIRDQDMHRFLELCFCCPCCCTALNLARSVTPDVLSRFRSVGWKAEVGEACTGCGACLETCPVHALSLRDGRAVVREDRCLGCGLCAAPCLQNAIQLRLREPLREDIADYFAASGLELDLK